MRQFSDEVCCQVKPRRRNKLDKMMNERPGMRRYVPCTTEDGQTPELWEDETIDYELNDVELSFGATKPVIGSGKFIVTSKRVLWLGVGESAFDFDVPYIALHAITRDPDSYPKPCIYCQLDCEEDCGEESDEDETEILDEMFLAPSSEENLQAMFNALSAAALNNPDPLEDWEQEGDDELIYNTDEVELGAEQARTLDHLDSVFNIPECYAQGEGEEGDYGEEEYYEEGEGEGDQPGDDDN